MAAKKTSAKAGGIGAIPVGKVFEVLKSGKSSSESAASGIAVAILVDKSASPAVISAIKEAFTAEKGNGAVAVCALGQDQYPMGHVDICVVVAGGDDELCAPAVRAFAGRGVPVAVVCESALMAPEVNLPADKDGLVGVIASGDTADLLDKLARWIVRMTANNLAFPANFAFCRNASVESLINSCAAQNAAIGAVALLPGADMPLMTTNQAKLALDIAAAYGQDLTPERIPDLLATIGAGFVYRGIARQILGALPGVGTIVKAGLGFAGTVATGRAIKARMDIASGEEVIDPKQVASLVERLRGFFGKKDAPKEAQETQLAVAPKDV